MAIATFTHTPARIKFYTDLCLQRHLIPKNHLTMSPSEMTTAINEMRKFFPATAAQLDGIRKRVNQLRDMGVHIEEIPDSELYLMSGGKDGEASKKIRFLSDLIQKHSDLAPLNDEQLKKLSDMMYCVDVDFESHGIYRRITFEDGTWRRCTREEFENQIKESINHKDASFLIDKYRSVFYEWKKDRATQAQIDHLRRLEKRLIETKKPKVIEYCLDLSGKIVEMPNIKDPEEDTSNPIGYNPLDEDLLPLFSKKEMNDQIERVNTDIKRKFEHVDPDDETLEELRKPETAEQIKEQEYATLSDIMFKLEAIVGYEDPDLHASVVSMLTEDREEGNEYLRPRKDKIREFMLDALNNDAIDFGGLVTLCEHNSVALEILLYQY